MVEVVPNAFCYLLTARLTDSIRKQILVCSFVFRTDLVLPRAFGCVRRVADEDICAGGRDGQLQCAASWRSISLDGAGAAIGSGFVSGHPMCGVVLSLRPLHQPYAASSCCLIRSPSCPEWSAATAGAPGPAVLHWTGTLRPMRNPYLFTLPLFFDCGRL